MVKEIKIEDLKPEAFISEKVEEISAAVGDGRAINALSGGVDSSAVTLLGHRALGDRLTAGGVPAVRGGTYADAPPGGLVVYVDSTERVALAHNGAPAALSLRVSAGDTLRIVEDGAAGSQGARG